jgi:hypothetical protein
MFGHAWQLMEEMFAEAQVQSIGLEQVYERLKAPPIGLKDGPIPVLVIAALLAQSETVALYENGSFLPRLDPPVLERLARNPELFSIKSYASRGSRIEVTGRLAELLGITSRPARGIRVGSVVSVVGPLLARVRSLPEFAQKTRELSQPAIEVRSALFTATEPDSLLFHTLPKAVGASPFIASDSPDETNVEAFIEGFSAAFDEICGCFAALLDRIEQQVREHLRVRGDNMRQILVGRISQFSDAIINPEVKAFVLALTDEALDRTEWLSYIGMVVVSKPPTSWSDDDARRFELRLSELAAAVRRIEGLHYERADVSRDGFEAVRVGFTTPDGRDNSRVVWIDSDLTADLGQLADEMLARVEIRLGPDGREMLLAKLAMEVLGQGALQTDVGDSVKPLKAVKHHG